MPKKYGFCHTFAAGRIDRNIANEVKCGCREELFVCSEDMLM